MQKARKGMRVSFRRKPQRWEFPLNRCHEQPHREMENVVGNGILFALFNDKEKKSFLFGFFFENEEAKNSSRLISFVMMGALFIWSAKRKHFFSLYILCNSSKETFSASRKIRFILFAVCWAKKIKFILFLNIFCVCFLCSHLCAEK